MNTASLYINDRKSYARWLLLYTCIMVAVRIWSGRYLTYIFDQPMKGPDQDYTFWITFLTHLPQFVIHHLWACKFVDSLAVVLLVVALFFPGSNKLFIALILVFFLEHITVEAYSVNHSKNSVCLFMGLLPLCVNEKHFSLMAGFVRYFVIYILVSAAYHKLHNGAISDADHFQKILIQQHLDLAILHPQHMTYLVAHWLIGHPFVAYLLFMGLFFMQAVFALGIFSRRFDLFLFFLLWLFVFSTYFLMRIYIWEMIAGGFVFLLPRDPRQA